MSYRIPPMSYLPAQFAFWRWASTPVRGPQPSMHHLPGLVTGSGNRLQPLISLTMSWMPQAVYRRPTSACLPNWDSVSRTSCHDRQHELTNSEQPNSAQGLNVWPNGLTLYARTSWQSSASQPSGPHSQYLVPPWDAKP